jgi:putative ABC transport system substrate-binding protein
MRRRSFITLLGGSAAAWPMAARAQQPERLRRIGVLTGSNRADPSLQERLNAFRQGLEKLGWAEGRNILIDYRSATADRIRPLAKELVNLEPDVLLAHSTPVAAALQQETHTIPIVFLEVSDPIGSGFIASLARPGGNLTGLLLYEEGIPGKWLAMLKEVEPALARVALMANPKTTPYDYFLRGVVAAARSLAIEVVPGRVESPADIERVIESLSRLPNGGVITPPDSTVGRNRDLIINLVSTHRLPAVYSNRFAVLAGGLMSYSADRVDAFRQAASYLDRILRGAKPVDLPVQTPIKYETVINMKTAKALGLNMPTTLLARADEVIE